MGVADLQQAVVEVLLVGGHDAGARAHAAAHGQQGVQERQGQDQQGDGHRDQQGELVAGLGLGGAADAGDGGPGQQGAEQHRAGVAQADGTFGNDGFVLADSATGELAGLRGTATIAVAADGTHQLTLDYELDPTP
ncbi:MAG: DUF3224 domain-containing protein [Actinomycetes bacterium]